MRRPVYFSDVSWGELIILAPEEDEDTSCYPGQFIKITIGKENPVHGRVFIEVSPDYYGKYKLVYSKLWRDKTWEKPFLGQIIDWLLKRFEPSQIKEIMQAEIDDTLASFA